MHRRTSLSLSRPLLPILVLACFFLGCGRDKAPDAVPYSFDFLAEQRWIDGLDEPPELPVTYCPDLTRRGLVLKPGRGVAVDLASSGLRLDRGAELVLETCSASQHAESWVEVRWTPASRGAEGSTSEMLRHESFAAFRGRLPVPPGVSRLDLRIPEDSPSPVVLQEVVVEGFADAALADGKPAPARAEQAKNEAPLQVLLISLDTLREDGIGALGGEVQTPHLDALVADSEVWSPHYSAAGWTQPSHATLLTGRFTPVHGVQNPRDVIHPGVETLAERFAEAGFPTAARVYDCVWLDPKFGFARGFDDYAVRPYGAGKMVREVSNWITDHRAEPFFFFFHTFEPHSDFAQMPYEAPGWIPSKVKETFDLESFGCRQEACSSALLEKIQKGTLEPLDGELEAMEHLYRRGIEHTDRELGQLFERIKALGLWEQMMIVVTSDHGEAFAGVGRTLHGGVWNEILQVPLIVKWPEGERAGERRGLPTGSVDVAPTLLGVAGLDGDGLPGTDLRIKRRATPVFAGTHDRVVFADGWKGVFKPQQPPRIYDLAEDPGELRNLAEERPEERERLLDLLRRWRSSLDPAIASRDRRAVLGTQTQELSEEEIQRLKSLGYLSDE